MSENTKLRIDSLAGLGPRASANTVSPSGAGVEPAAPGDEAESAMRRALGLLGDTGRHRPDPERSDTPSRMPDRFGGGAGLHRRRFVQDGDVPVTVLRRDSVAGHEAPAAAAAPTSSRLQRTEAALAAETAARAQAERALHEALASIRDLQTKIGHADLGKHEAIEALRLERESTAVLRQELDAVKAELAQAAARVADAQHSATDFEDAIAEERQARRALEKALRAAEAARDTAERLVQSLSEDTHAHTHTHAQTDYRPTVRQPVTEAEGAPAPKKRGRPPIVRQPLLPELEPEPVKWWLAPAKAAAKKR